ncbi:glycosyltransferase family 4 protein [Terrabacter aeriphilus]|uniref:Glycosyltransferase family 4 protein n=1 Tax=Terrabacter aeriphilus TaxID=515662 RepID=A0ABP9J954_9MICO
MTAPVLATTVGGLVVSVATILALLPLLRSRGVVDVPVDRSMHAVPTPRGGGLGIVAAACVSLLGVLLTPEISNTVVRDLAFAVLPVVAMAAIGLVDDLRTLSVVPRLGGQAVVAAVWATTAPIVAHRTAFWVPLVVLGTIVLVNITNFMDGINGLVSGHAVITSGWYAVVALVTDVPAAALLAAAVLGGSLGFLPFNVPQARVFLGDVGSYGLGAIWAVLSVWLLLAGAPVEALLAPLVILLTDSLTTLVRRMANGDRIFEPHRLHVYQRLTHAGWSHLRTSCVVGALTLACVLLTLPGLLGAGRQVRLVTVVLLAGVGVLYVFLPRLANTGARWSQVRDELEI